MYSFILLTFSYYFRGFIKWFLHRTTGLCELQRICYGAIPGATRIKKVEDSLNLSRSVQIKRLLSHLNDISDNRRLSGPNEGDIIKGAVTTVLLVKHIDPLVHEQFVTSFSKCVEQIWGYRQLAAEVEKLRTTPYDSDNLEHERMLNDFWNKLMPYEPLECRISKQWQHVGFQGDDPKTDFRGMGLLGLENLLYFASEYNGPATHVLNHSHHPEYGYAFAIVGINITSMAWQLLRNGEAKTYFYNMSRNLPNIKQFHRFYCYLFYEFDRFWIECKPKNIMEFSSIKDKFENNIKNSLLDPASVFRINIAVDTI